MHVLQGTPTEWKERLKDLLDLMWGNLREQDYTPATLHVPYLLWSLISALQNYPWVYERGVAVVATQLPYVVLQCQEGTLSFHQQQVFNPPLIERTVS
jgi:hypothetical protein